ncbi:GNAT family N-acetyltransferase [Vibrio parahaemolyticus]|nr:MULTISPECIES: GNAT family N-acetyltransferase [Vibrio harveyi group]KIT38645.1 N-acetyltransferase [Vibrio parahaemolyticus 3644]KIT56651.1 N-acetyltransferase [Vibrio parahaemolyticus EN9701072]MCR9564490.1 GNAT family N-acetyltransferase [Vibrio alginolyticus]RFD44341.1 acetyltransferase [Vibrio parahaemolyticus 3355]AHJ02517.1 Histone acetyltransferase HPA2 [Vibrio parahaemolyticus UCM-V493]|eukprot:NODE_1340_length_1775_cov_1.930387_g1272_i0.p3 GENE.NODE_1340_length_1775_cov_1.930387_g1272_i0~~NODE_1340_length_1775_cov_1.930387_g1272_i0.p3  ORF type:complete len:152 (+),score=8.90 NODE_1340_length_1775_cov_1.930387_g1272_i0:605-1060(+)
MRIEIDDLERPQVLALLEEHLQDMYATSPPESVHALDVSKLKLPSITFWTGWDGEQLLGCVAMSQLEDGHAELKSMRTTPSARKQGVASRLLNHVIEQAKHQGIQRLSLETGSMAFFEPAHRLYEKHGFVYCEPFGDYQPDPNSRFMTLAL